MSDIVPQTPSGPKKVPVTNVIGTLDGLKNLIAGAKGAEFNEWKDRANANKLFDYFAAHTSRKIVRKDLEDYFSRGVTNGIERETYNAMIAEKNGDLTDIERSEAEQAVSLLLTYLQERSTVISASKKQLTSLSRYEEVPPLTSWTFGTAKDALGTVASGFMNASVKEKALMIAGVAALTIALKAVYNMAFSGEGEFRKTIKNTLGVILGVGTAAFVMGLGYEAAWKATRKTDGLATGMKLPNFWIPDEKATVDRVYSDMATTDIPTDFLNDITTEEDEQRKYAFSIANLAGMTAGDFHAMIEEHPGTIPQDSLKYKKGSYRKDQLTPVERWRVAKEMGESLGLLKVCGTLVDCVPLTPAQKKLTLLYLSLERCEELQKY